MRRNPYGSHPDERIRTPMAWSLEGPHAGFTRGVPWQRLGGDSLSANVAAQEADPGSLLALYRRLIHLRAAHPEVPIYVYPAGHGFNCDQRGSYHAESARLARERTLAFLHEHLTSAGG